MRTLGGSSRALPNGEATGRDPDRRWFVVKSLPRKEVLARQHLELQDFEAYLPLISVSGSTVHRTGMTRQAAFFPGYLFVRMNVSSDRWRSVNGTIGVSSILQSGGRPAPVPVGLVEHLLQRTNETGELGFEDRLSPGAAVRIVGGPFDRLMGEFRGMDGEGRARVWLDMMGRPIAVSLARESITAV